MLTFVNYVYLIRLILGKQYVNKNEQIKPRFTL